jgi:hypothetical protein
MRVREESLNKRKKVAWAKHRAKAKKLDEKKKATRGRTS